MPERIMVIGGEPAVRIELVEGLRAAGFEPWNCDGFRSPATHQLGLHTFESFDVHDLIRAIPSPVDHTPSKHRMKIAQLAQVERVVLIFPVCPIGWATFGALCASRDRLKLALLLPDSLRLCEKRLPSMVEWAALITNETRVVIDWCSAMLFQNLTPKEKKAVRDREDH